MKAAIWARVSTAEQETQNQVLQLTAHAERRGDEIVATYEAEESAYKGKHLKQLSEVYEAARLGRFRVLYVWALDRLSRQGTLAMLEIIDTLERYGVRVVSLQESFTESDGPERELYLSIIGWMAKQESARRSERTKAGLERVKSEGKTLGRPKGATDKRQRTRSGYFRRYAT